MHKYAIYLGVGWILASVVIGMTIVSNNAGDVQTVDAPASAVNSGAPAQPEREPKNLNSLDGNTQVKLEVRGTETKTATVEIE